MNKESAKNVLNEVYLSFAALTKKRELEEAAAVNAQTEALNQRLGSSCAQALERLQYCWSRPRAFLCLCVG